MVPNAAPMPPAAERENVHADLKLIRPREAVLATRKRSNTAARTSVPSNRRVMHLVNLLHTTRTDFSNKF